MWNGIGLEKMDATFRLDPGGTLIGFYHVYDPVPFDGTLTGFHQTGHCEADFNWHDKYGTGIVHIEFKPNLGRFLGRWGNDEPLPGLVFNGYRIVPPLTS